MKKVSVIVLVIVGLMFAAHADAARPKHRTRNANRIGPYAGALVGSNRYTSDQSATESDLESSFVGIPTQNLAIGTEEKDIGYQAAFGYRFNRYLATEFELAEYGDLVSTARADVDLGTGFLPVSINIGFHVGGPKLTAIGILPLGERFEIYGSAGALFASTKREFTVRVNGDKTSFGSVKGDSTEIVLGIGAAFHVNQMYTIRAQIERIDEVGDENRTGTEDITVASLGLIVRF
jgi:opacity protein-like surface antigen